MMRMWLCGLGLLAHSYRAAVGFGAADFLHPAWLSTSATGALWGAGAAMGAIAAATGLARAIAAGGLAAIPAHGVPLALSLIHI